MPHSPQYREGLSAVQLMHSKLSVGHVFASSLDEGSLHTCPLGHCSKMGVALAKSSHFAQGLFGHLLDVLSSRGNGLVDFMLALLVKFRMPVAMKRDVFITREGTVEAVLLDLPVC